MPISLKTENLKRYRDIFYLIWKYGHSDMVKNAGVEEVALEGRDRDEKPVDPTAEALAADLEKMGPTWVKIGQMLSTRADLLPPPVLEALARLQDDVAPFPFAQVEETIHSELGVRISKAFATFEEKPVAAASLGQVHRATLRDGRPVAVKVQRPEIRQQIIHDLDMLGEVADFFDEHTKAGRKYEFGRMLEEFRATLLRELDYRMEAGNMRRLADDLQHIERIVVPRPVKGYVSAKVLTMDYIRGTKVTKLSPLAFQEIDGEALADQLFRAYLEQILLNGFFHADPHPGNVFVTDDHRVALLDLGMVARVTPGLRDHLLHLLLAVSDGRGDEAAEIALRIGERKEEFREKEFRAKIAQLVQQQQDARIEDIQVGKMVMRIAHDAAENRLRLPHELTMLGKTMLNLDEVGRCLDPKFKPNEAIRRHAADIVQRKTWKDLSPTNLLASALEMRHLVAKLPGQVSRLLDAAASNELKVTVDAIDEVKLMEGFQKVANRITLGLILAALIIGAALLMRVETTFKLFGYPGIAILLFLAAALGGVAMIVNILFYDEHQERGE